MAYHSKGEVIRIPKRGTYRNKSEPCCEHTVQGYAEDLSHFPDNSFDAVIETLVFCSVTDVDQSLKEIHRVLKPSGNFLLFGSCQSSR